jgi:hypothetical protein
MLQEGLTYALWYDFILYLKLNHGFPHETFMRSNLASFVI